MGFFTFVFLHGVAQLIICGRLLAMAKIGKHGLVTAQRGLTAFADHVLNSFNPCARCLGNAVFVRHALSIKHAIS